MTEAPTKPEIEWATCDKKGFSAPFFESYACLSLENAKKLVLYLHAVEQWQIEVQTLCGEPS